MKDHQRQVEDWVSQYKIGYFQPLEILARLTEETGELAREINHRFGPKKKKAAEESKEVADEVADIMFTLICLANSQKIDLDDAFSRMMDKLSSRDSNRYEKKELQ